MKRERVRIETKKRGRPARPFVYKPRNAVSTSLSRATIDAPEPADRVFVNILEEIRIAAAAERAGWAKLERYLANGTVPARPRIRIRT